MSFANDYFRADALTLITSRIQSFVYNGDILWSERERGREGKRNRHIGISPYPEPGVVHLGNDVQLLFPVLGQSHWPVQDPLVQATHPQVVG